MSFNFCIILVQLKRFIQAEKQEEQAYRNRMRSHNTGKLGNEACKNTATQLKLQVWVLFVFRGKRGDRKVNFMNKVNKMNLKKR